MQTEDEEELEKAKEVFEVLRSELNDVVEGPILRPIKNEILYLSNLLT
jgi:hypothetical protein